MYQGVATVLDEGKDTLAKIPALVELHEEFQQVLDQISEKDKKYLNVSKGATADKDEAEDKLIEALVTVSASLYVYARRSKQENIKSLSRIRPSALKKMRDSELAQKALTIYETANEHKEQLSKYGVDQAIVDGLKTKITNFENAMGTKESKFAESKAARQELGELFDVADDVLKEDLDYLVELTKDHSPEFYNKYQAARVIKDL